MARSREEFAARLRALRTQAGSPPFRQLAKITNYSSSTLSDATSGKRLPTEAVLRALVTACGADPAPWADELRRLAAAERTTASADDRGMSAPPAARNSRTPGVAGRSVAGLTRRRAAGLALGALAVFAAGLAAGRLLASAASAAPPAHAASVGQMTHLQAVPQLAGIPAFAGTPSPAPTTRVADGTDPRVGHCEADAHLIDRAAVIRDGVQIGALDLMYSQWCQAGWARLYLYPGEPTMMGEVTVRSGDGRFNTFTDPLVKQVDDYTNVVVPGPGGCLGAGGAVYEAGKQAVTASIPCEVPTSH